jgi:signal peptidase II
MNPLSETTPPPEHPAEPPVSNFVPTGPSVPARIAMYRDRIFGAAVILVVFFDQLTKFLIRDNMSIGQSVPSSGFFRLTYYENSGTIFGLFQNATVILTVVSIIAIGFLVYFYRSQRAPTLIMRGAIGILMGGAIGNLIDRLALGGVTDFVDVGRWPIFNIADASITVGIFLLIVVTSVAPKKNDAASATDLGPNLGDSGDPGN